MLRDPEVQRGLRVLAVLPARLKEAGVLKLKTPVLALSTTES